MWIVDCCHLIFNEKCIKFLTPLMRDLIVLSRGKGYLALMAEFNGLLRGRNNRSHLGPAPFPAAPNMQTHTLCFNKSLQHHRQHSTAVQRLWKAASEVLPLRFMSLCNIPLCQVTHYANALFTVHVTISRHESQWGPGGCGKLPRETEQRDGEQTLWKNCQRNVANDSLTRSQSFYTSELAYRD